jgi:ankyrin repeat protein
MKFSINFVVGLTLIIVLVLATVRLGRIVAIREIECVLEKPFEKHFATGRPVQSIHSIEKEIREYEKILIGFGIPLNSTRFREDISLENIKYHWLQDPVPALYFADRQVQQLCRAINTNNLDEMRRLIKQGVDVNMQGDGGITPLIWAFAKNKPEAFRLLLENKADPDLRLSDRIHMHGMYSNVGDTLFTANASFLVSRQFLRDAIPYSKNINQRSSNGDTLLMAFARPQYMGTQFDKASCESLIAAGVDLNAQNALGESVCTLSYSQPEKCLWFIEKGADPSLRQNDGTELLDLVSRRLEEISKINANKPDQLGAESYAARIQSLQLESDYLALRDAILEFKKKRATEAGSTDEAEN